MKTALILPPELGENFWQPTNKSRCGCLVGEACLQISGASKHNDAQIPYYSTLVSLIQDQGYPYHVAAGAVARLQTTNDKLDKRLRPALFRWVMEGLGFVVVDLEGRVYPYSRDKGAVDL